MADILHVYALFVALGAWIAGFSTRVLGRLTLVSALCSLINAYLRSVSLEDAGVRFKPKIESFAVGEMPALPSRQA